MKFLPSVKQPCWRARSAQCIIRLNPPKNVETEMHMTTKALTKSLVTVYTVRAANGRIMSTATAGKPLPPAAKSANVQSKIRNVSLAGQYAMEQSKKRK